MADNAVKTFPVVLRTGEDGWIVAECPVLVGCISQGRTREEALANIGEAIALCLEVEAPPESSELVETYVAAAQLERSRDRDSSPGQPTP